MDGLPYCIRDIIEREPTAKATVERVRAVFNYWTPAELHRVAGIDQQKTEDPAYRAKLDELISYTEAVLIQ